MRTVLSKEQIAYDQGYASYVEGIPWSLNPYPEGSAERSAWYQGWERGQECNGECNG